VCPCKGCGAVTSPRAQRTRDVDAIREADAPMRGKGEREARKEKLSQGDDSNQAVSMAFSFSEMTSLIEGNAGTTCIAAS
jgi:hypothetical protein